MNKSLGVGCLVVLIIVALLGMSGCNNYNKLVGLAENVDKQWAQVETQYQRRMDLIPNLVSTVEGQANFEKTTLTEIADARASVGRVQLNANEVPDAATLQQWEQAQSRLGGALGRLMAVSENYPALRANEAFLGLQTELAGTENRISVERGRFNEAAQGFNTQMKQFPTVVYAAVLGFSPKAYFKSAPQAAEPPKVQFNMGGSKQPTSAAPAPAAPVTPALPGGSTPPPPPSTDSGTITTPDGSALSR
jgi:LemA protein